MSDNSKIEWTDATWPITVGCTRTAPKGSTQSGCGDASGGGCYAEQSVMRVNRCQAGLGKTPPYADLVKLVKRGDRMESRWTGKAQFFAERLSTPLKWKRPRRIFVSSQSDLFHHDITNEQIAAVFGVMGAASQHSFQVLTKRTKRMREWFAWLDEQIEADAVEWSGSDCSMSIHDARDQCRVQYLDDTASAMLAGHMDVCHLGLASRHEQGLVRWPFPNVFLGTSVENQAAADERIPELLSVPAALHWISAEPLLESVNIEAYIIEPMRCGGCGSFNISYDTNPQGLPPLLNSNGDPYRCLMGVVQTGEPGAERCNQCQSLNIEFMPRLGWTVSGCESGHGARPCDVEWLRSLRDQCAKAGVPYFLKQSMPVPGISIGEGSHRKPGGVIGLPYLDGVQHAAMPKTATPEGER